MCKLIYSMTVSLDGYISGPQGEGDWTAPDEERHRFHNDQVRELGGHLLGRRLYEVMSYWETAEERNPAAPQYALEFARIWKDLPKVVYSKTLTRVEGKTRLSSEDPVAEGPEAEGTARGAPRGGWRDPRRDLDATRFDRRVSPLLQPCGPRWRQAFLHRIGAEYRACTPRDTNLRHGRPLPALRASMTAAYAAERLQNSRQNHCGLSRTSDVSAALCTRSRQQVRFGERRVRGQDQGGVFVAAGDQLEEQVGGVLFERDVAEFLSQQSG